MGNVTFTLDAVGAHHNHTNPDDLNKMFVRFVDQVKAAGHVVTKATMHHGGAEDLLSAAGPTRSGVYGSLARAATAALVAAALLWPGLPGFTGTALAADQAVAVKKVPVSFQYPSRNGFYVFIGTEGGGGKADFSGPGVNPNSVTTTSIDVHGGVGYVWAVPNTAMFANVQVRAGWTNFNGESQGFSFSGPLAFEERFTFGAPTDQLFALFPNLFGASVTPPPFTPPGGQTIVSSKWYIGATLDQRDISLNYGAQSNKIWAIGPGIVLGNQNQLSGGTVADVYAKVRFDDKGFCVGAVPTGPACGSVGTTFLAGIDLKWGI